jgi:hypothetical protein
MTAIILRRTASQRSTIDITQIVLQYAAIGLLDRLRILVLLYLGLLKMAGSLFRLCLFSVYPLSRADRTTRW